MGATSFRPARLTPNFNLPVPADEDPADFVTDIGNLADAIDLIVQQAVHKPGDLIPSFASARPDALLCDGRLISGGVAQYPALAAACPLLVTGQDIRLPDLRGCAIIGAGQGVGPGGGALTNRTVGGKWGSESPVLQLHNHTMLFESQVESGAGHQHYASVSVSGSTGFMDRADPHQHYLAGDNSYKSVLISNYWTTHSTAQGGTFTYTPHSDSSITTVGISAATSINHAHSFSGSGGGWTGQKAAGQMTDHSHTINGATYNAGADATGSNLQPSVAANIFIKT